MSETATKPFGKPVPRPDVDPREAGRVGGVRSGEVRRAKRDAEPRYWGDVLRDAIQENPEQIVRNLMRSRNGAALAVALQLVRDIEAGKMRRLADIDAKTTRLDNLCCQLMDDCDREQARKDSLRAEVDALGRERRELERLRDELRTTVMAEADAAGYDLVDDDVEGGDDASAPEAA